MNTLNLWFHDLFRPTIKKVKVVLYEKNAEKNISEFDTHKKVVLMKAIQELWQTPPNNTFHFEAEVHEQCTCFKKKPSELFVVCYEELQNDPTRKRTMNIPIRYRSKLLNKRHILTPEIEVKFTILY